MIDTSKATAERIVKLLLADLEKRGFWRGWDGIDKKDAIKTIKKDWRETVKDEITKSRYDCDE